MNYNFYIYKYTNLNGEKKERPSINIEECKKYGWLFYDEINNLSSNLSYVKEIVTKLEDVLAGKIDFYEGFGYEVYMIECDKKEAKVVNIFEDDKIEAVIPTMEVYELMRDWRDYLIEWYKNNKKE